MIPYNTPEFHKYLFDAQVGGGYTTTHYQGLINLHQQGAQWLYNQGVRTAFEIGSGLGFFLQAAKRVGIEAKGYDINNFERDFAIENGIDPETYILGVPDQFGIDGEYDAFYSTEVFEHIVDETLIPLVEQIAEKGKWFFFTSTPNYTTPENDEAWGHINIKPVEKWIEFFEQHGLTFHSLNNTVCSWGIVMTGRRFQAEALKPSNFTVFPEQSKCWKMEPEKVAQNIMVVLSKTGNEFRELTFEEYKEERIKDGDFHKFEESLFSSVKEYCMSAESAKEFSPEWNAVFLGIFKESNFNKYQNTTSSPFFNKENEL